jgi:dihydrofolate synthase/folylpolyglutamate synthase
VVVSIGLDHQEYLGTTLEAIAREKAGILRRQRPAVLGSRDMPEIVEALAQSIGAPLKRLGREFTYDHRHSTWHYRGTRWDLPGLPAPGLRGEAQYANAATAIAAIEEIAPRLTISPTAIAEGIKKTRLAARFQVIAPAQPGAPTWILDVSHNPAAARVLAQNLRDIAAAGGRTLAVVGILADKDAEGIAAELRGCVDAWWCVSTEGERGRGAADLAQIVGRQVTVPVEAADSPVAGCAAALAAAKPADRIVVFGSFHTVGPVLDWLEAHDFLPPDVLPEYTAAPRATYV